MKININRLIIIALLIAIINPLSAHKNISYADVITSDDLESYISFLASPLLKGRLNGAPELEVAQQYIVSQAKLMGLKPVYQLVPSGPSDFTFDGEVVFAGYGLKLDKHGYNDFEDIETEGKILLVMNRAPSTEDGEKFLFEETRWSSFMSIQVKLPFLIFSRAKAVIFVMDPKSGFSSLEEPNPGYASVLNSTQTLKGEEPGIFDLPGMPKVIFVHRSVADELLKGSGYTLEELQNKIDTSLKPQSFELKDKKIMFTEKVKNEDIKLNNIAACVEGSDHYNF